ncbi:MAG TPA: M17 family peptidase N-terminal domain-containing protein, partial [Ktedonobacterales bacterium]|nr:M17 family peptidase N-terminal domain-containing protein [Ktedonobacterales bacterium]
MAVSAGAMGKLGATANTRVDVKVSTRDVQQFTGDALAVGVFSDDDGLQGPAAALDEALAGVISALRASGEITGAADETTLLHTLGKIEPTHVLIVGLGPRARCTADRLRRAAAIASRTLRKAGARHVGLAFAWIESGLNLALAARAASEGALLGLYEFTRYKSSKAAKGQQTADGAASDATDGAGAATAADVASQNGALPARRRLTTITIIGRGREQAIRAAVERGRILAESANFARDLGNEPPNVLTP